MTAPPRPTEESSRRAEALLDDNGLDRSWLERVLDEAGIGGSLAGLDVGVVGTGQVGDNVRCHLTWDAATDGAPASVILKLPSADETSRATGGATRSYVREVGFYRDVAPSVGIRVPAVHHLWEDQATNRFVLVMEDITPAETGDQLRGCSLERAELAVDAAAALHGSTWGRADELAGLDWVDGPTVERRTQHRELLAMVFPGFVDRYGDRLSSHELAVGHWLVEHYDRWQTTRGDAECLVHGDFRLDNVLFGLDRPAPPITTVDWQTAALGSALNDVAYFLSGSLAADELASVEDDLLDRYRRGLAECGVELDAERTARDYALGAPTGYAMAVIASQIVGQTERGDEMFIVMARGSAALTSRLGTAGLVG
ncbi:MAG: phosphotransferase [Actinomycetota bacterium]